MVSFTIPFLTTLPNKWQRMHWRAKSRQLRELAQIIALLVPQAVQKPQTNVRVSIVRYSSVEPDPDAKQFVKPILDVMQPPSKRHPYGIGLIVDDSSEHIDLDVRWERCKQGKGRVTVNVEPRP